MSLTISALLPGETAAWTVKVKTLAGVLVGTGTTSGIYAFTSVGSSSRYQSASIPVGAEPGAVAAGDHLVELFDPDAELAESHIVTLVDAVDNPVESTNAGLDGPQMRAALGLEQANLGTLVNGIAGKNNVVNNGDGTYDIAIRNDADTATLRTIRFNPTTGAKTVV